MTDFTLIRIPTWWLDLKFQLVHSQNRHDFSDFSISGKKGAVLGWRGTLQLSNPKKIIDYFTK